MSSSSFSLDLGESFIKIADVTQSGDLLDVKSLGFIETDPAFFLADSDVTIEKQGAAIAKLISQLHITKKNVNVVVPDSYSYNQFIEMPRLTEKELLSAIRYQADQFIPMSLEEVNLDIEVVWEDIKNNKILALIAASPKKFIDKVEKVTGYAGLVANSLETEMSATSRLLSAFFKNTHSCILVNLGFSSTSLYFFDENLKLITFSFNFNIGYNLFLKEIQVNLNIDQKKAIQLLQEFGNAKNASYNLETILAPALKDFLGELQKTIGLFRERAKGNIQAIYLFNDAYRFNALDVVLNKYFAIPTSRLDISPFFRESKTIQAARSSLGLFIPAIGGNLR